MILPSILKAYDYLPENLKTLVLMKKIGNIQTINSCQIPRGTVVRINPYQTISLSEAESRLDKALKVL
jgi:hypothetical protein